jgi:hypothetical protein
MYPGLPRTPSVSGSCANANSFSAGSAPGVPAGTALVKGVQMLAECRAERAAPAIAKRNKNDLLVDSQFLD